MAEYNSLNVKLSNSQLNKIQSAVKNKIEVFLRDLARRTASDKVFNKA